MFEKNIIFSANKDYVDLKENYPKPIKLNIPEWFKKLDHSPDNHTIKGCIPFMETLTTGYLLSLPQDFILKYTHISDIVLQPTNKVPNMNLNMFDRAETHPPRQFAGSPMQKKNLNSSAHKILNPWIIKTPPGYSCLFTAPLNNSDDRFTIISGIVNTDTFDMEVNFPFYVNGEKYPAQDTVLKRGTPYVQVIPFKRDSWKMNIKTTSARKRYLSDASYFMELIHRYKNVFWNKVKWK